jgi:galactokinase
VGSMNARAIEGEGAGAGALDAGGGLGGPIASLMEQRNFKEQQKDVGDSVAVRRKMTVQLGKGHKGAAMVVFRS